MSTQEQRMDSQDTWDQPPCVFHQPEESPYLHESAPVTKPLPQAPQQRRYLLPSLNSTAAPGTFGSIPSTAPFVNPSGFTSQQSMQSSSFDVDANLILDSSSTFLGASPLTPHINPAYNQPTLNALELSPSNFQAGQVGANLEANHTPENSSNPNFAMNNLSPSHPYLPTGPMQFSPPLPLPPRQSELQSHYFNTPNVHHQQDTFSPSTKRPKPSDDYDDIHDDQFDTQEQEAARPKPLGACARCKSLKVRCEFKANSDTCKRCKSAGQECVIPGRKPRRAPPKREHLLNQIREQAKQIQELMVKMEALSNPAAPQRLRSSGSSLHPSMESNSESVVPNAEMQDWISKARVSIQEFGGLIPAGDLNDLDDDSHNDEDPAAEEFTDDDDESGYATAEDDMGRDIAGSPASSTTKRQAAQTTKLKLLPGEDAPYGLMAVLSIRTNRERSVEPGSSEAVGVANANFFRPTPGPDHLRLSNATGVQLPHILVRGIVSIKEVDMLYNIYFEKMNQSANLLDPALHTPQYVAMRCPFLFTIICRIASRFYEPRPHLYQQLTEYGQLAAGNALISGTKNEEMAAAYLLMQLYPIPAKRWDEERSWIYLGVAIRIAQDINLNRVVTTKPLNEQNARILLSRQRIWMNCFNLDRSTGTQFGKRSIIPNTDFFAMHSEDWWRSSPYNMNGFDIHLCGYNAELRVISGFLSKIYGDPTHPIGLNKNINVAQLASDTDDALRDLWGIWFKRLSEFEEEKTWMWPFRTELLRMAYAYARLVALSTGLKHAKDGQLDENTFIARCFEAASDIVNAFVRRLFPTPERKILLRHAPDAQFVFVTFAGAFLVKLLLPKYAQYFTFEWRQEIRALVQEAVDLLGSPEVVVDDKHGPKLFSRFLAGLLATQSVDPDTLSPRSTNSRSKAAPCKNKEPTRSPPSLPDGPLPEMSSQPGLFWTSSPPQQFLLPNSNASGYSPSTLDNGLGLNTTDFNQGAAMPIDQELLDSIQFMSDPVWQDTTMPGFSWVNQLNQAGTSATHTNDYAFYESLTYATSF